MFRSRNSLVLHRNLHHFPSTGGLPFTHAKHVRSNQDLPQPCIPLCCRVWRPAGCLALQDSQGPYPHRCPGCDALLPRADRCAKGLPGSIGDVPGGRRVRKKGYRREGACSRAVLNCGCAVELRDCPCGAGGQDCISELQTAVPCHRNLRGGRSRPLLPYHSQSLTPSLPLSEFLAPVPTCVLTH